MRACTCRGAAARKRTNSSPFSGSCLESFLVPCPCSTRISITQYPEIAVSQSVTIGWVSQNTATKCVVGETCIMLVRVPFLFCLAHTMCSVLRSRHATLAVSFTHYRTCIRTSYVQLCFKTCVRSGIIPGTITGRRAISDLLKVRGPCPDVEAEGFIHFVVGCIVLIPSASF